MTAATAAPTAATAVDALACGVVVLDPHRRIVLWNRWMAERAALAGAAVLGRGLCDAFPELEGSRLDLAVDEVLATGMPSVLTHRLNRTLFPLTRPGDPPGVPLLQSLVLKPVADGGCLIQIDDVTGLARREETLRLAQEARHNAVVDHLGDAVLTVDEEGRSAVANLEAARLFGWARADLVGLAATTVLPGFGVETWPVSGRVDVDGVHRNGTALVLDAACRSWRAGARVFRSLSLRDVTERRRAERRLAEGRDRALAAARRKTALLAGLGRELRTPLNVVVGFADLLAQEGMEGAVPVDAGHLDDLREGAHWLQNRVEEVLLFARIESGGFDLSVEVLSLAREVEAAVAAVQGRAAAAGVTVTAAFDRRSATVMADRQAFRHILDCVLSNAIAYSPSGCAVDVRTDTASGPCVVSVADAGVGIAAEDLERVLEPFEKGPASAWGEAGAGLGLSIAKALMEAHGGRLALQSRPGVGTTVSLEFPSFVRRSAGVAAVEPAG